MMADETLPAKVVPEEFMPKEPAVDSKEPNFANPELAFMRTNTVTGVPIVEPVKYNTPVSESHQSSLLEEPPKVQHRPISPRSIEKRRSFIERYPSIGMPPLKEEATPTSTPANTLPRHSKLPTQDRNGNGFENIAAAELEKAQDGESSDEEMVEVSIPVAQKPLIVNFGMSIRSSLLG
jgi:hypothetical protein